MNAFVIAVVAFACVIALGFFARLAPIGIDANVARLAFGKATSLAWAFTNLGYARDLVIVYAVAGVALEIVRPHDVGALVFLAIAQVASQLVSTGLKGIFKRRRPENWLKRHEQSAGYPSGHATTATVTYGGIALAAFVPLDGTIGLGFRETIAFVAVVTALGIVWSRLALGAHYLSDVIGGAFLGASTLAIVSLVLVR